MKTITLSIRKLLLLRLNLVICALSFTIPIIVSHPQWITGTVVNCLLYLTAEKLSKKEILPVIVLPSLGAITYGVLFGPQTIFLYYFLPFIWVGNYLLISLFSALKNQNYFIRVVLSSFTKYLFLVVFANIYFGFKIVPKLFITSMGMIQLVTALSGGILSYFILKFLNKNHE
ncbi:hypothetical protein CO049_01525 [Candidatus Roizmanbacteria bacterium CG_4_9_14_0_2_um_filter_36_12]|uniref:ECF transporter S component n=1 Tax=Candidatus Roizmanbacteria bacterium CG_4_9_14_0_2_um_filter_36_12 TaxID=1974837 RepID=A0A2M8F0T6_9BACT|nr:MAG: hypothetical protein CO049_01525 [Candidatus Roizmanbacteria bacterium CG_4_9_14_0_2_um_filter_36_12]